MKLTPDETRALAFIAALLLLSAAVRIGTLPEPVAVPGNEGFDLDAHIAATAEAVEEEERRRRPLAEGERVDPNTAPAVELDRLPGVGPALADRIVAARADGRFSSAADLARVPGIGEKTVARLAPFLEVASRAVPVAARGARSAGGRASARDMGDVGEGVIDLNRATVEDLVGLRGVGEVLAGRIVAYRDSAGPFPVVDSLVAVRGIGPATLERLRPRLRVR